MGRARSLRQFQKDFPDEASCAAFLVARQKSPRTNTRSFVSAATFNSSNHQIWSNLSQRDKPPMMNLRQVVEAGACAAYAIANPDHTDFVDTDEQGILDPSQKLARKRYTWLDEHYPEGSQALKDIKEQLNSTTSHANLINAYNNEAPSTPDWFASPFFDIEDSHYVQTDLWRIGNTGLVLMLFFHEINSTRNVIKFVDNFGSEIDRLRTESEAIRAEMMATTRFKAAMQKEAERSRR
jgi:hypothetical protein